MLFDLFLSFKALERFLTAKYTSAFVFYITGFVVSKTKYIQRLSKIVSAYFFKDFSKNFESNQLSKNCECKHHFCPVISPATSHLKKLKCTFSSIFANSKTLLFNQSILLARKSYNQLNTAH
jgi:hypothetical protein